MTIDIKTTEDNYTTLWLVLWQGALNLTPRERDVLAAILDKYLELDKAGVKPPYLWKLVFDTDARKEYCEKIGLSSYNLTNLLGGLKEKKALVNLSYENDVEVLGVTPHLLPKKEITFRFVD